MASRIRLVLGLLAALVALPGCTSPAGNLFARPTPTPTVTPVPPTPTPEPAAALVNGQPILLATYTEELARFEAAQAAVGIDLATLGDYKGQVLQALIDRRLLAQGASQAGITVDPMQVDQRMEDLAAELGSTESLAAWLAATGYSTSGFAETLREELLAAQMVEQIAGGVPVSADQVHARHVLVATRDQADNLVSQIQAGADLGQLAAQVSLDLSTRPGGGDLGWFPRGYLWVPEVEDAAFALEPGQSSDVVESALGFHVVEVLERGERPLSPGALQRLRELAVEQWLTEQRQTAAIEIYLTP